MSKKLVENEYESQHHQHRVKDKKKRHRAGYSDEIVESRATRVSFKNYVRQLEEQLLEDNQDEDELN